MDSGILSQTPLDQGNASTVKGAACSNRFSLMRVGFASLWLAFSAYAFLGAPPNDPQTLEQIVQLSTGQWQDLNPLVIALFNAMGLWPIAFASLLLWDGFLRRSASGSSDTGSRDSEGAQRQSIPAWPFVVASFGLGAFAILPYLVLRSPHATLSVLDPSRSEAEASARTDIEFPEPSIMLKILRSSWLWGGLAVGAALLLGYGLTQGDWADFASQWRSSRFIHVMSLDFCLLTLLFPLLAGTALQRVR